MSTTTADSRDDRIPDIGEAFAAALADHQDGRFEAAERAYWRILWSHPKIGAAEWNLAVIMADRMRRASALYLEGRAAEAAALCRRVLEHDPGNVDALHLTALILGQSDVDASLTAFDRTVRLHPGNETVTRYFQDQARRVFQAAFRQLHDGAFAQAAARFDRIAALVPDIAKSARTNLEIACYGLTLEAIECHRAGRTAEAAALYDGLLRYQPGNSHIRHLRDSLDYERTHPFLDLRLYSRLSLRRIMGQSHTRAAEALAQQGDPARTVTAATLALEAQSWNSDARLLRADALAALGRWGEAADDYRRIQRQCGATDAALHEKLAAACAALGHSGDALYHEGCARDLQGRREDALDAYDRALKAGAAVAPTELARGNARHRAGETAEAATAYERAVLADPVFAPAAWNRWWADRDLGVPAEETARNVRILVACHKPSPLVESPVLMPVHVGKALSDAELGHAGDDTGDNISARNRNYCELTALYWAWKNAKGLSHVGLCHYRRYLHFGVVDPLVEPGPDALRRVYAEPALPGLLASFDLVLPREHVFNGSVYGHWKSCHTHEIMDVAVRLLKYRHPGDLRHIDDALFGDGAYLGNMFVMRWDLFDRYMAWLFDLLFCLEDLYSSQWAARYPPRISGHLSERLFKIFVNKVRAEESLRICEVPIVFTE